ncbi:MAG TPA: YidC/Oxa1 family membrane protein insertase, partial [Spirochaetota bacterium]|nr:YidC/Oxa1 family membrane protein insertase [Spirochaetota bacterium]
MHILYNIFIMPLESLMRLVLENSYQITGSYGIAILFVSLMVCIGVLPVYLFADKLQDKERDIQLKMKRKLDEFKSVYKGAELHAYVKNLYRLHGYHPVYGLRSLIGLAIQIPFFIAAFHLLSNYSGMSGNAFLFFDDLAKPDGLLKISGHSLNIMPFVMTAVNLASAFIYGKKITVKENVQLYVMALLFLVLLYASPSGLLLYWTCNNIFNLLKNIIYCMISPKGKQADSGETAHENISLKAMIAGARTGLKNCQNALFLNYGIVLTVFAFIMLYLFLGYLPDVKKSTPLSKMIISAFALIVFIMNVYLFAMMASAVKKRMTGGLFSLTKKKLAVSFFVIFILSILYLSTYFHLYGKHIYSVRLLMVMLGLLSVIAGTFIINRNKSNQEKIKAPASKKNIMPIAECVLFLFFFCCFIPFIIFLPSAEDLGGGGIHLVFFALKAMLLFSVLLTGALFIFRKRFTVLAELIVIFILIGITFGYVYQKDFGIMRGLHFVNEKPLSVNAITVLIDILIITMIVVLVKKLYKKYRKEALICLVLVFAVQSAAFYISNSGSSGEDFNIKDSNADNEATYSQKEKKLLSDLSFSKDKDNIFIMFLDGFPGFLASDLIRKYPEYVKEMTGFVFYRNTVSAGSFTYPSFPAMLGGHKSEIDKLNAIESKNYGDKYQDILVQHAKYFSRKGYQSVYCNIPFAKNWDKIIKAGGSVISKDELILFRKKHGEPYKTKYAKQAFDIDLKELEKGSLDEKILIKLCLFKVLPYLHKHQVYFKTEKIFDKGEQFDDSYFYRRYVITDSLWSSLPSAINDTSDVPTIKWIRTAAMNRPYHINQFGGPAVEENREKKYNTGGYDEVFMTANYEFELLNKAIKRMKELNIYDNTTIILVSDH